MTAPPPAALTPGPAEAALDTPDSGNSSAGMGRRVAGGGAWTALGEIARFVTATLATKALLHMLSETSYGVWILVTRVSSSLSFADAGVGVVSTTYVSQAYARADRDGERRALWTALLVGLVPSLLVACLMLLLAPHVVHHFFGDVPTHLRTPATIGLQVGAFGFVLRTVTAVFNSPLLARMQLGKNTLIFYSSIVLQLALAPLAIAWGGIAWGASVSAVLWALTGLAYLAITARLLPGSLRPTIDRELLPKMARFGAGTLVVSLASQALATADILIVGSFSTREAAHYQIAYSAANVLSILSAALASPLQPAFSRLLERDETGALQDLVRQSMRALCLALPPLMALMCVCVRPFFLWQGGPNYVLHSTPAFLCFLGGMALSVVVVIPFTLLMAMKRTDLTARIGLFEVVPFVLYTWGLTWALGIVGAALGRGLRFAILCAIVFPLASRIAKIRFSPCLNLAPFALALACTLAPIALSLWPQASGWAQAAAVVAGIALYAAIVHARVLDPGERALLARMGKRLSARFKR